MSAAYTLEERFKESVFHIKRSKASTTFMKIKGKVLTQPLLERLFKEKHPGVKKKEAGK